MSKKSRALDEDKLDKVSGGDAELTQYYDSNTGKNSVIFSYDNDPSSKAVMGNMAVDYLQGKVLPNGVPNKKDKKYMLGDSESKNTNEIADG